jgi:hypothetical protein
MPESTPYTGEQVRGALADDPRVGELDIQVRIAGGRVFLTGSVATDERRQVVGEIVGRLLPSVEVCNGIEVMSERREPGEEHVS